MDEEVTAVLERIRKTRVEKEISIIQLASLSGLSHSYIYYLESKKKVPSLTILFKLAKALGVDVKDWF